MVRIIVNGAEERIQGSITLYDLLESKGMVGQGVVVEVGQEIIPRGNWWDRILLEDEQVEILRFVGGG